MWQDQFRGQLVLYVGPGTGLGGAVLMVGDDPNQIEPVTDGHIYDIMIDDGAGNIGMAEDLVSGRAVIEQCGVSGSEINADDELWALHQPSVVKMGDAMVRLIQTLTSGSFQNAMLIIIGWRMNSV